jgi:2-iminobutanoate/2-iminopropanoate deaminase
MTRQAITTSGAPGAIGPYSQGIDAGDLVFCSGFIGLDPATGELVEGGIEAQVDRAMRNLAAVLDAAGLSFGDVTKTTCYLVDLADFATFNGIYGGFLTEPPPARTTIQAAALPKGALFEVEAVARRPRLADAVAR